MERKMFTKKLLMAVMFVFILVAGPVQAGGDPARGEELSVDCADCHGADGLGDEESPRLAGLDADYHVEQLMAYKSGERTDEDDIMSLYAEDLSEQDMKDLAAYYATLPKE
jgi:cytochrome c553